MDTETKKPLLNSIVYIVESKETQFALDSVADTLHYLYYGIRAFRILYKTKVDSTGNYLFRNIPPSTYGICASYTMPEKAFDNYSSRSDYDFNIVVKPSTKYYKVFHLMATCPYDKTKDQDFCPVCKKKDEVSPIFFGLPPYSEDGKIDGKPASSYYFGGCLVDAWCNPTKYCWRCKKKF